MGVTQDDGDDQTLWFSVSAIRNSCAAVFFIAVVSGDGLSLTVC